MSSVGTTEFCCMSPDSIFMDLGMRLTFPMVNNICTDKYCTATIVHFLWAV